MPHKNKLMNSFWCKVVLQLKFEAEIPSKSKDPFMITFRSHQTRYKFVSLSEHAKEIRHLILQKSQLSLFKDQYLRKRKYFCSPILDKHITLFFHYLACSNACFKVFNLTRSESVIVATATTKVLLSLGCSSL